MNESRRPLMAGLHTVQGVDSTPGMDPSTVRSKSLAAPLMPRRSKPRHGLTGVGFVGALLQVGRSPEMNAESRAPVLTVCATVSRQDLCATCQGTANELSPVQPKMARFPIIGHPSRLVCGDTFEQARHAAHMIGLQITPRMAVMILDCGRNRNAEGQSHRPKGDLDAALQMPPIPWDENLSHQRAQLVLRWNPCRDCPVGWRQADLRGS